MRNEHTLWKVSNGFILVPEGTAGALTSEQAAKASVFKSLKEFADYKPKRVRNRKGNITLTPTTKEN